MPPATACGCSTGWSPTITSPERFGVSGIVRARFGATARIRLAGSAAPGRRPRLAIEDAVLVSEQWVRFHDDAPVPVAFDLAALGPLPVRLNGPGLVWAHDTLLDDNTIMPVYVPGQLARSDGAMLKAATALPVRCDPRPALVFHGWGVQVYGHFLIEMLPKLLLAARFPALFGNALPVLDRAMPDWLIAILREHCGIDPSRAIWFDSRAEQLDLDQAVILPLLTRVGGYHPLTGPLVDGFVARTAIAPERPTPRLFVARGDFSNPAAPRRRLTNEAELAGIVEREFGFAPIHPEILPFAEQVGLFAQAEAVVGQAGSGMHNALFAPAGCRVGMIRFPAPDQSAIASLRGHRIAYLTETVSEPEPGVHYVNPQSFRTFLARLLDRPEGGA